MMKNNPVAILTACIAFSIQLIFLIKREWLFQRQTLNRVLIVSVGLFVIGMVLILVGVGSRKYLSFLTVPIMSLTIFIILKNWYIKKFKEMPKDTFWTNDLSLVGDAGFNILFWILGISVPVLVLVVILKISGVV